MKRLASLLLAAALPCLVHADELADGVKAWEQRDFAKAHQVFSRLANAGNPQAQQLLGEMYGFGEGVPEDPALARRWLEQARAAGNKAAGASLQTLQQRAVHKADIARYQQADQDLGLTLAGAGCVKPVFPKASTRADDMKAISKQVADYRACYEKFVAGLSGKSLPSDVANVMSLSELERARSAYNGALARSAANAYAEATKVIADNDAWVQRSRDFSVAVTEVGKVESDQRLRQMEDTIKRAKEVKDGANRR